jgi:hypothetical protein
MRDHSSLDLLITSQEGSPRFSFLERTQYHLPVSYRIRGDYEKARTYVGDRLRMNQESSEMEQRYREFADKFLASLPS